MSEGQQVRERVKSLGRGIRDCRGDAEGERGGTVAKKDVQKRDRRQGKRDRRQRKRDRRECQRNSSNGRGSQESRKREKRLSRRGRRRDRRYRGEVR